MHQKNSCQAELVKISLTENTGLQTQQHTKRTSKQERYFC